MNMLNFWRNRIRPASKTLYIVRGISGSGKSTLAAQLTPFNVAADDFPNLYSPDGRYNFGLRQASQQWCQSQVEQWMGQGHRRIAVHNTFTKLEHLQPYLSLAASYGYAAQIIHVEGTILPDGQRTRTVHNLEPSILERQCSNWEPLDR